MSDENYKLLSGKLDAFQANVDSPLDGMNKQLDIMNVKMLPVKVDGCVNISAVIRGALAFVEACAVVIFNSQ